MASHYEKQFLVHQKIDETIRKKIISGGEEIQVEDLIYEITSTNAVSEKMVEKRINSAVRYYSKHGLKIEDGTLYRGVEDASN